jgi:hypothetical protein
MNMSHTFKQAHKITRDTLSQGREKLSYRVTFGAALKIVIAAAKRTTLVRVGKTVSGNWADMVAFLQSNKTVTRVNVDVIELSNPNKNELAEIDALIAAINTPAKKATTGRYVELLATAERLGLSHGKSWVCSGFQIDRDSIDPSFEDELVCYVYPVAA